MLKSVGIVVLSKEFLRSPRPAPKWRCATRSSPAWWGFRIKSFLDPLEHRDRRRATRLDYERHRGGDSLDRQSAGRMSSR